MSRTTTNRLTATGLLTLTAAATGLVFAPTASAAGLPGLTHPTTVTAGEAFTVSGEGCVALSDDYLPFALVTDELDDSDIFVVEPDEDGSWSAELTFPAGTSGEHEIWASCLNEYQGETPDLDEEQEYPVSTVDVELNVGAIRGVEAITPGTKAVSSDKTTSSSAAGQKVVRVIEGFQPGEVVTLVMHSTPVVLGTFTADSQGVVTAEFTLPAGTAAGTHTFVYEGNQGTYFQESYTVSAALDTAGSGKKLAHTGADITVPLTLGAGLVLAGAGALVVSRRRNAGASQA
jgi:LPXTG-motif cell wall-anchored protein